MIRLTPEDVISNGIFDFIPCIEYIANQEARKSLHILQYAAAFICKYFSMYIATSTFPAKSQNKQCETIMQLVKFPLSIFKQQAKKNTKGN